MTGFDNREKAYENKYALDEEMKFKIASRRRKLLGLWAAEKMGFDATKSLNYAMEIVSHGIEDKAPEAVIKKIVVDFEKNGKAISDSEVKQKNNEFEIIATRQLTENKG